MKTTTNLNRNEWDFSGLAGADELEACCVWEYARESKFIRDVTRLNEEIRDGKWLNKALGAAQKKLLARLESICNRPDQDPKHFYECPPFPQPWLSLDKTCKPPLMRKIPAAEYAFQAIDSRLPWGRFQRPNSGGRVISKCGVETLLVEIDWGGCTDNQIAESVKRWISSNRPQGIGKADTKGKRIESRWLVMLDNLAIMRLLHHAALNEMSEKYPVAWKRYGPRKAATEKREDYSGKDWYRARQNANKNFHELFPFLTAKEFPLSW